MVSWTKCPRKLVRTPRGGGDDFRKRLLWSWARILMGAVPMNLHSKFLEPGAQGNRYRSPRVGGAHFRNCLGWGWGNFESSLEAPERTAEHP